MKRFLIAAVLFSGMLNAAFANWAYLQCQTDAAGDYTWSGPVSNLSQKYQDSPYDLIFTNDNSIGVYGSWDGPAGNYVFVVGSYIFGSKQEAAEFCHALNNECMAKTGCTFDANNPQTYWCGLIGIANYYWPVVLKFQDGDKYGAENCLSLDVEFPRVNPTKQR